MNYGETHSYSLISVNGDGYSTRSESVELLFCRSSDPPENVTISTSEGSIMIEWDIPFYNGGSWITNYRLLKDGAFLAEINNITLEYLDENVEPGILYEYTVMAINVRGGSQGVNVTIEIPIIPPIISGVTTSYDETGVQISWVKPEEGDVTDIEIYRIKDDGEPMKLTTLDVNETSFLDDSTLEPGTYCYYLIGVNRYGNSTSFLTSEVTIIEDVPSERSDESDGAFPWFILLIIGLLIVVIIAGILYVLNKRKKDSAPSEERPPDDTDEDMKPEISSDPLPQVGDNDPIKADVNTGQIDPPPPMETTTLEVEQNVAVPSPQNTINTADRPVQMEGIQEQQPEVIADIMKTPQQPEAVASNIETPQQPDPVPSSNNDNETPPQ